MDSKTTQKLKDFIKKLWNEKELQSLKDINLLIKEKIGYLTLPLNSGHCSFNP